MKGFITTVLAFVLVTASLANERRSAIDSLCNEGSREIYINPSRALELGHEALDLCEEVDEKLQVLAVLLTAYRAIHDYDNLVTYGQMTENLAEKGEMKSIRVRTYIMLASLYHSIKLFQEGLQMLDKAETILVASAAEAPPEEINFLLGNNYLIRAFIYRDQVGCHIAKVFFEKSITSYGRLKDPSFASANISTAHYNYGNCLMSESRHIEAEWHYNNAIATAESAETPSILGFALKGLGNLYTLKGNFDSSLVILAQAQYQATGIGDPMLEQSIHAALANNYLAKGNWNEYLSNSQKSYALQEQILENSKISVLHLLQSNFNQYSDDHQSVKRKNRNTFAAFIAGCLMILALIIFALRKMNSHFLSLKSELRHFRSSKA